MPAVTKAHGLTFPTTNYGLTPRYFKIDTGNVNVSTNYNTDIYSSFALAVSAINSVASIITLGTPSGNAFVVQVDDTFGGRENVAAAATLVDVINDALPTANVITVTESTGFVGADFNAFA